MPRVVVPASREAASHEAASHREAPDVTIRPQTFQQLVEPPLRLRVAFALLDEELEEDRPRALRVPFPGHLPRVPPSYRPPQLLLRHGPEAGDGELYGFLYERDESVQRGNRGRVCGDGLFVRADDGVVAFRAPLARRFRRFDGVRGCFFPEFRGRSDVAVVIRGDHDVRRAHHLPVESLSVRGDVVGAAVRGLPRISLVSEHAELPPAAAPARVRLPERANRAGDPIVGPGSYFAFHRVANLEPGGRAGLVLCALCADEVRVVDRTRDDRFALL
mmetsp:Transcript_576/g.2127  ORF Transcript_576/g.2127 Transcript_576/m.2127 type:complete len:275 (-) Transcript_576:277-1101(-)